MKAGFSEVRLKGVLRSPYGWSCSDSSPAPCYGVGDSSRVKTVGGGVERLRPRFLGKKPPLVPDPSQRVRLRAGRGRWRGRFRAVSHSYTDASGLVVVRVAEERERVPGCPPRGPPHRRGGVACQTDGGSLVPGERVRRSVLRASRSDGVLRSSPKQGSRKFVKDAPYGPCD